MKFFLKIQILESAIDEENKKGVLSEKVQVKHLFVIAERLNILHSEATGIVGKQI